MHSDPTKKLRTWLLPPFKAETLKAGLYVTATPIGNLRDITLRALDTLQSADIILCEDTRVTKKLLSHFGLAGADTYKKLWTYNDHGTDKQRHEIVGKIANGAVVVLVSDAGTPLISDPGYKLMRDVTDAGYYATVLPGANAPLSALQLSAMPSDQFCFLGFLPNKTHARAKALDAWKDVNAPLVIFESAKRILKTLAAIHETLGNRSVAVVREMTKMFEETRRDTVVTLIKQYEEHGLPKGEVVIVINGAEQNIESEDDIRESLKGALTKMSMKDAVSDVASKTHFSKKDVYAIALEMKNT